MDRINADDEVYALWSAANVNSMQRLGMTDHGPVHVKIVMNIAIRLFRLLMDARIEPGVVKDHGLTEEDAGVVVALGRSSTTWACPSTAPTTRSTPSSSPR
jgi:uncharacterized protein